MQKIKFLLIGFIFLFIKNTSAQELNARVTVMPIKVNSNVPRSTFVTLQKSLTNLLNNRKWTNDVYTQQEKIECSFQLTLTQKESINEYDATLTVQSARPVFNTSYQSPIINFQDNEVYFKYVEFQPIEFNENRIAGSDANLSNLSAVFAFYANMIIAFDNASFSPKGGDVNFQKALFIANNAPEGRGIKGWRSIDGLRNRFWLVENMTNTRFSIMHDVYYNYYRGAFDKMYEDEEMARAELINVINLLQNFTTENRNSMIVPFFFQGKSNEIIKIMSKAQPDQKERVSQLLQKIDITNSAKYKEELK